MGTVLHSSVGIECTGARSGQLTCSSSQTFAVSLFWELYLLFWKMYLIASSIVTPPDSRIEVIPPIPLPSYTIVPALLYSQQTLALVQSLLLWGHWFCLHMAVRTCNIHLSVFLNIISPSSSHLATNDSTFITEYNPHVHFSYPCIHPWICRLISYLACWD